ncbi:MAG TPA: response regulator [Chthoniobacterales bacterium]|jgi:FixJ family two-component response regulator|nr:response regulator [Chthoniobacterales bacterium]
MICIVDDDASVLRSLRELLASDGLDSETFDRPDKFLHYACANTVELAVLDLWMPTQNGIEVQERLLELSPDTRVIIITGSEEPVIRTLAAEGGAFALLIKPFEDEAFLDAVHGALGETTQNGK